MLSEHGVNICDILCRAWPFHRRINFANRTETACAWEGQDSKKSNVGRGAGGDGHQTSFSREQTWFFIRGKKPDFWRALSPRRCRWTAVINNPGKKSWTLARSRGVKFGFDTLPRPISWLSSASLLYHHQSGGTIYWTRQDDPSDALICWVQ